MPRSSRWRDDSGSAALEFSTAGMLLLIPLVYLVVVVATIQSASLAAEGAARQAVRLFVLAGDQDAGRAAVERAVEVALADHGLEQADAVARITCDPTPSQCLSARSAVTVEVELTVPLPLVPAALDLQTAAAVPIVASATQYVSRFRVGG